MWEFFIVTAPASIVLPYAAGFIIGYSSIKLFQIYCPSNKANELKIDSGLMRGYTEAQERNRNRAVWVLASFGGFLNLILFTFLLVSGEENNLIGRF